MLEWIKVFFDASATLLFIIGKFGGFILFWVGVFSTSGQVILAGIILFSVGWLADKYLDDEQEDSKK